jgi:hypothetical protein
MPSQSDYYRTQADTMREQAEGAVLDNVRDRCLRSAEAWTQMAERAERHQAGRAREEAHKAAVVADQASLVTAREGMNDHFR